MNIINKITEFSLDVVESVFDAIEDRPFAAITTIFVVAIGTLVFCLRRRNRNIAQDRVAAQIPQAAAVHQRNMRPELDDTIPTLLKYMLHPETIDEFDPLNEVDMAYLKLIGDHVVEKSLIMDKTELFSCLCNLCFYSEKIISESGEYLTADIVGKVCQNLYCCILPSTVDQGLRDIPDYLYKTYREYVALAFFLLATIQFNVLPKMYAVDNEDIKCIETGIKNIQAVLLSTGRRDVTSMCFMGLMTNENIPLEVKMAFVIWINRERADLAFWPRICEVLILNDNDMLTLLPEEILKTLSSEYIDEFSQEFLEKFQLNTFLEDECLMGCLPIYKVFCKNMDPIAKLLILKYNRKDDLVLPNIVLGVQPNRFKNCDSKAVDVIHSILRDSMFDEIRKGIEDEIFRDENDTSLSELFSKYPSLAFFFSEWFDYDNCLAFKDKLYCDENGLRHNEKSVRKIIKKEIEKKWPDNEILKRNAYYVILKQLLGRSKEIIDLDKELLDYHLIMLDNILKNLKSSDCC